ncbi:hypothetical protein TNCT_637151 [Trichonephila clavata]|uniref:Uncharacterized protein n=1 Tax=Trichonephila clavata TaxID=2740835 RepID=A0A8X6EXS0_TRICU|nr:hypothetical protein TNCT_637151 [Trichonephila clavata]
MERRCYLNGGNIGSFLNSGTFGSFQDVKALGTMEKSTITGGQNNSSSSETPKIYECWRSDFDAIRRCREISELLSEIKQFAM